MTALVDLTRLVKPLKWHDVSGQYECRKRTAPALGGHYMVVDLDRDSGVYSAGIDLGGLAFVMLLEPDKEYGGRKPRSFPSIEAAQAAANADNASRVIAALDAELLAEVVGALRAALLWTDSEYDVSAWRDDAEHVLTKLGVQP